MEEEAEGKASKKQTKRAGIRLTGGQGIEQNNSLAFFN